MKKCSFCAKEISYHEMFCNKDCENAYNKYFSKRANLQKLLSTANILGTCLIAVSIFVIPLQNFVGLLMMAIGCFSVGLITLLLPTPTDNMVSKHKLQKAIKIVKIFGLVLIAFGIGALIFAFFKK